MKHSKIAAKRRKRRKTFVIRRAYATEKPRISDATRSPKLQRSGMFIAADATASPKLQRSGMFIAKDATAPPKLQRSGMFVATHATRSPKLQ